MKATKSEQLFKRVKMEKERKGTGKKKGIVYFQKRTIQLHLLRSQVVKNQPYETPDNPSCRSNHYSYFVI